MGFREEEWYLGRKGMYPRKMVRFTNRKEGWLTTRKEGFKTRKEGLQRIKRSFKT